MNQLAVQPQFLRAGKTLQGEIEYLRTERCPGLELRSFDAAPMLLQNAADGFIGCIECMAVQQDFAGNLEHTLAEDRALGCFPGKSSLCHQAVQRKPLRATARYAQEKLLFRRSAAQGLEPLHRLQLAQSWKRVRVQHPTAPDGGRR